MKRLLLLLLILLVLPSCGGGVSETLASGGPAAPATPRALTPPAPPDLPDATPTRADVNVSEARSLVLQAGWNLVSFPVAHLSSVTAGPGVHPTLFAYDADAGTYRLVAFTPEAINADGGPGRGFWALASQVTEIGYEGSGTPATAELAVGWNLVGLPAVLAGELQVGELQVGELQVGDPSQDLTTSACSEVPAPDGCLVHRSAFAFDAGANYVPSDLGSRDTAFPGGRGYWLFVHRPVTLYFPGTHLVGLEVEPWTWSVPLGTSQPYRAIGRFDDGTSRDVSAQVAWTSSHPALASVDGAGVVRAHSVGRAEIRAAFGPYSDSAVAFASDARPVRVEVSPANPTFPAGSEAAFTATAIYSDGSGRNVTTAAEWRCADNSISFSYGPQRARIYYVGTTSVSATWDGLTGSTPVTVTEAVPQSLTLSTAPVPAGYDVQFGATANYTNGLTPTVTNQATWTSSDPSVLAMSSTRPGLAQGVAAGTAIVTVSYLGLTRQATVTVSNTALQRLWVTPDPASVPAGRTVALKATAYFVDSSTADVTERATWSVGSDSVAQVSNAPGTRGLLGGVAPGSTTVQAALAGVTDSGTVQVSVATVASIAIETEVTTIPTGASHFLKAIATMSDGRTADLTEALEWSVTAGQGRATVSNATGSRGLLTALSAGSFTVKAQQSPSGPSGTLALEVLGADVQELRVSPSSLEMPGGTSQTMTVRAILSDGSSRDFTPFVTWTVEDKSLGSMSGNTFRSTWNPQTGNLRASWNGVQGTAPVTITAMAIQSLQITGDEYQLVPGSHRQLSCSGYFTNSYSHPVTEDVLWVSDDPAIAKVSSEPGSRGLVLGVSPGQTTVRAVDPRTGVSSSSFVLVRSEAVTALTVTPATRWIQFGAAERMKALGILPNTQKVDFTRAVTWASDAPAAVAVSNGAGTEGTASARGLGAATLQATHAGLGLSASAVTRVVAFEQAGRVPVNEAVAVVGDPTGTLVYVLDRRDQVLRVLEVASRREVARVDVGSAPADMVMTPDGRSLFVAAEGSGAITRVSLPGLETSEFPVTIGLRPRLVALGSRNRLFVVSAAYPNQWELAAYDRDTGARGEVILTGHPFQVPVDLNSSATLDRLFVSASDSRLTRYDTSGATAAQLGTTTDSTWVPHALSPDGAIFAWFRNGSPHLAALRTALDFGIVANLDFGNRYILEMAFGADSDWLFAATGGLRIDLGTASSGQPQTWFEVVPPAGSAQRVMAGLHPLPGGRTLVVETETFWNITPREAELWFFTIRK